MNRFLLVLAGCVTTIVFGLALAAISGPAGSVIAVAGFVGFGALLVFVMIKAARNNPGAAYAPGKGHREWREEYEKAARDKAARERSDTSR